MLCFLTYLLTRYLKQRIPFLSPLCILLSLYNFCLTHDVHSTCFCQRLLPDVLIKYLRLINSVIRSTTSIHYLLK